MLVDVWNTLEIIKLVFERSGRENCSFSATEMCLVVNTFVLD